jgi:hypothetical protein
MYIPTNSTFPVLSKLNIEWQGHPFSLPYFYREGSGGPAILFVHGLGGSKENFYWALQSPALADCTLAMFDEPGTGLSEFRPNAGLNVSSLAEMTQIFADRVLPAGVYAQNPPQVLEKFGDKTIAGRLAGNRLPTVRRWDRSLDAFDLPAAHLDGVVANDVFHDFFWLSTDVDGIVRLPGRLHVLAAHYSSHVRKLRPVIRPRGLGPPSASSERGSIAVWHRRSTDRNGAGRTGGLRAYDDHAVD